MKGWNMADFQRILKEKIKVLSYLGKINNVQGVIKECGDGSNLNIIAMTHLGNEAYMKGDYKDAFEWYKRASLMNGENAIFKLGLMYYFGNFVKKDYDKSFSYIKKASGMGVTEAMVKCGDMYYYGEGVEKDLSKTFIEYERAYVANNTEIALLKISVMYRIGEVVEKDLKKAFELTKKCAEMGNNIALQNLACFYYDGELRKSFDTFIEAEKKGNKESINFINTLFSLEFIAPHFMPDNTLDIANKEFLEGNKEHSLPPIKREVNLNLVYCIMMTKIIKRLLNAFRRQTS